MPSGATPRRDETPMPSNTRTYKLAALDEPALRSFLTGAGFAFSDLPYAHWQARRAGATVSFYRSGKLLVQGRDCDPLCAELDALLQHSAPPQAATRAATRTTDRSAPRDDTSDAADRIPSAARRFLVARSRLPDPLPDAWVGIDETGKGDYFGPLVVAAARVHVDDLGWLAELGVGDSKGLTDARATQLAQTLAPTIPHHVLVLAPDRYNELYAEIGNLNHLLAWAHAAAADSLLAETDAELILSDQFTRTDLISRRLRTREHTRSVRFTQRTRAEDDAAVACASILARARFLAELRRLERAFGVKLAKGAGSPVLKAGRALVRDHGRERLRDVAKLHFKTTGQIGG
ncbi:MAG: ribonuclease HIII [Deltaproteobacteria bacterium]|nr:MAG: ribonuclease HIII [Deltaproteobacteria bacterium]